MLGDHKYIKTFAAITGIVGGIVAIVNFYRMFFPEVKTRGVEITNVRVQAPAPGMPSGGCESQVLVSLVVKIAGYKGQPVKLYTRLDDSAATSPPANGLPCQPPMGAWDGWQHAKDVTPSFETETVPLDLLVTTYFRKENRSIQVKATDANERVLYTAVSDKFDSK